MSEGSFASKSTELARFHDALEVAERKGRGEFKRLFEAPPPGVSVHEINLQKILVRVSAAHEGLLGYSPQSMVGQPASAYIVFRETGERAMDQKLAGTKELKPFVRAFKRADGTPTTMLLLDRLLRSRAGKVIGVRTVLTAISDFGRAGYEA